MIVVIGSLRDDYEIYQIEVRLDKLETLEQARGNVWAENGKYWLLERRVEVLERKSMEGK